MSDRNEDRIWSAVEAVRVCMMTTADGGRLRARPMHAMAERDEGAIWFFTDVTDRKDDETRANPQACLAFAEPRDNLFVSLSGRVELVDDRAKARGLWSPAAKAYFPNGPDDPNLRLLRFVPERGEYWDGPSSAVVVAAKMAGAILGGTRPDLGDNEKVSF